MGTNSRPAFVCFLCIVVGGLYAGSTAVVGLSQRAAPESTPVQITGVFSDMHVSPETGDIGGAEVIIMRSLEHGEADYFAVVQFAFGKPDDPVLTRVMVTKPNAVEFEVPGTKLGTFRGRVTSKALAGAFDGNGLAIRLPRGKSFYQ